MRLRLILSFLLIAIVSVSSVVLIARQSNAQQVRAFMFRGGMVGVEALVDSLEAYYQQYQSWEGVEELLAGMRWGQRHRAGNPMAGQGMIADMMNQRLRLADADGTLIADTLGNSPAGQLSPEDLLHAIPLQVSGLTVGYLMPEGGMVFTPGDEANLLSRLNRVVATAGLIAVIFSLILALLLSHQMIKPIRALTQAACRLAGGDLRQRVKVRGEDELATLARTFNQMAASLQQAENSRRAMTADIAHELRNPLAVQQAHLEAILDGIYPATPESITPLLEQNRLLSRIVEDLRTLALVDAGQLRLEKTPTDMRDLTERTVERFRPQATGQGITIQVSAPQSCPPLQVDPVRMEQILGNLLSNALRFTPAGGFIEIRLDCTPEGIIRLSVHDNGSGIPEESLPHLFERFYRADRGRSRAEGGSGLGLAIARQLARAHDGDLTAANHPHGGAIFTLSLPVKS